MVEAERLAGPVTSFLLSVSDDVTQPWQGSRPGWTGL